MSDDKQKVGKADSIHSGVGAGASTPPNGGNNAYHWYDPIVAAENKVKDTLSGAVHGIVEAEHKVEQVLAKDMDHTIHDMDGWQKKIKMFSLRHPNWWVVIELLLYIGVIGGFLAAQVAFGTKR